MHCRWAIASYHPESGTIDGSRVAEYIRDGFSVELEHWLRPPSSSFQVEDSLAAAFCSAVLDPRAAWSDPTVEPSYAPRAKDPILEVQRFRSSMKSILENLERRTASKPGG